MPAAKKDYSKLAGRLVLGRIPGLELDAVTAKSLADGTIGGVVLFKKNAESIDQVAALCKSIIDTAHHPPIIAVDQEGGAVQRFDDILTPLPSQMALAAAQKEDFVKQCAQINARQCKALGVNCLFAPVMDVLTNNLNPVIATRAFSSDEVKVSELSKIVLTAIAGEGITPVGKHFPGHGATLQDSHTELAVNPNDPTEIWKQDLFPFRECLSDLPAIMMAHVWLSQIDEEPLPASLSRRIVKRILREYFEYDGLIMTDDLTMQAITKKWGLKEAAIMALEAGNDLLLVCSEDPQETVEVSKHIAQEIKTGRLLADRLDQSVRRLEKRFGNRLKPATKQTLRILKDDIGKSTEVTLTASAASIALLTRGLVETESKSSVIEPARGTWKNPIALAEDWIIVAPKHPRYPLNLLSYLDELVECNRDTLKNTLFSEIRYTIDPNEQEVSAVAKQCAGKNCIYLTYRAVSNSGQVQLGLKLKEKAKEVVAVACESPFDITVVYGFNHSLATFDPSELGMRGLSYVLLGIIEPLGVPPVDLQLQTFERR